MWCFRASGDEIEQEGVRRAVSRSEQADLLIIMISVDELNTDGDINIDSEIQTRVHMLLEENLKVGLNLHKSYYLVFGLLSYSLFCLCLFCLKFILKINYNILKIQNCGGNNPCVIEVEIGIYILLRHKGKSK